MVSSRASFGDAADHLSRIVVRAACQQCVQAVLGLKHPGQACAAPGEGGVTPRLGVGRVLGVPRLMGPEEVAEPQVHQTHRRRRAATTADTR